VELEEARRARREVVRIGHREGCEEREGAEVFAASDVGEAESEGSALVASTPDEEPRPVLRLYGSPSPRAGTDLPALSGPAAPSIVAAPPRASSSARLPVTGPPGAVDVVPPIPERPLLVTDPVTRSSADVTTSAPGDAAAEGSPDGTREGFGGSALPRSAGSVTMSSAGPGVEDPVVREYRAALGFVEARRWNDALGALARFAAAHPDHPYADNALYWQGEVLYAQREYRRAMEILETMIRRYPRGNKVPDALLRLGYCSLRLGDPERARTYFERVRREHPDSVAARLASREET
jgi:tol-pal system protein YbgF